MNKKLDEAQRASDLACYTAREATRLVLDELERIWEAAGGTVRHDNGDERVFMAPMLRVNLGAPGLSMERGGCRQGERVTVGEFVRLTLEGAATLPLGTPATAVQTELVKQLADVAVDARAAYAASVEAVWDARHPERRS